MQERGLFDVEIKFEPMPIEIDIRKNSPL